MQQLYLEKDIELPEGVTIILKGKAVTVEGTKGKLTRDFSDFDVELKKTKTKINVKAYFINKKKKANALALVGYIQNMITGVTVGYVYKSKIVYSHFPITVEPDNKKKTVAIKNLYGGRKQINVPIVGEETTVRVEKDDVITEGIDKQDVGQTTANMQEACRLRGKRRKDPETFLDGVWRWDRN